MASLSPRDARRAAADDGRPAARRPPALGHGAPRRQPAGAPSRHRRSASRIRSAATSRWASPRRWPPSTGSSSFDAMEEELLGARDPDSLDADRRRRAPGAWAATRRATTSSSSAQLTRALEEAGYLERDDDRLELTPRAARKLGMRALTDIFSRLRRESLGGHAAAASRTRRRADRRDEGLRARRPVRGRPQPHPLQRDGPQRAGNAGAHRARRTSRCIAPRRPRSARRSCCST